MSGEKKEQRATEAENKLYELGQQQVASGRATERPNLRHLQDVSLISDSDRANAAAAAKAGLAEASTAARSGAQVGLRQRGVNSGAYRMGLEDATGTTGSAAASAAVGVRNNLDDVDLQERAGLVDQGLTGMSESTEALRSGASGLGRAQIYHTINRNLKSELDADNFTNLGMMGLRGLGSIAASRGLEYDGEGRVVGFNSKNPFASRLAKLGILNRSRMLRESQGSLRGIKPKVGLRGFFQTGEDVVSDFNGMIEQGLKDQRFSGGAQ